VSNFFTPEFNNESAIGPWNASLEPTKAIIPKLDANRILTAGVGQEVNIPTLTPEAYDNIILPDDLLTRMASALTTDSNTSLPDSSMDLLTGQAMSEVYGDLSKFAAGPDFVTKMNLAFGENWDAAGAKALAEGWFHGDFSDIPPVKVVSSAEIGGANGAFAAATNTIYLSKEFLDRNAANPAAVADVLLEEIGHSVDARLNVTDSPGDEGAIFAAVVQGKELSQGELQGLKGEDDTATVAIDGQDTTIEMSLQQWLLNSYADWRNPNFNWQKPDKITYPNGNRPDGKDGIYIDWFIGSPFDPPNISGLINRDYFATNGSTQAYFEAGKTYKFRVSADDNMIMGVGQSGQPFNWLTLNQNNKQVEWQNFPNGSFKEYTWTPTNSGSYQVQFWHLENTGEAKIDISWEVQLNGGSASLVKFGNLSGNDRNLPGTVIPYPNPFASISNTTPERWSGQSGEQARYIQDPEMPVVANARYRSADQIRQVINYFNVEDQQNLRYKPNGWITFCNIFATDVMRALRAPLPHWTNTGRELDANGMNDWLNNSANGWKKVTPQDATKAASQGIPTVASWKNVGGIGHIAVVRPEAGPTPDNPQIAQAGAKNWLQTTVSVGFGTGKNVSYFAYYA
jgi:hypothetical protein